MTSKQELDMPIEELTKVTEELAIPLIQFVQDNGVRMIQFNITVSNKPYTLLIEEDDNYEHQNKGLH